ncbi:M48 family metallopeptidase [Magnetococcales bacterium HHB-1]
MSKKLSSLGKKQKKNSKEEVVFALNGEEIPCTIYRVASRKRMTLQVSNSGEVALRIPKAATRDLCDLFVFEQWFWLKKMLHQAGEKKQQDKQPSLGDKLPYLGREITLTLQKDIKDRGIILRDNQLYIPEIFFQKERITTVLEQWYRHQAASYLRQNLKRWADEMGLIYHRVTIRGQKTRWGSCSAKGNINLNWQLMFFPEPVIDYVLIHELCHRRHLDHSADFWRMVSRYMPDYKQHQRALKAFKKPW